MPKGKWTARDERKYKHIKAGYRKKGRSADEAESIAAATVNKARSKRKRGKK